MDTQTLVKCHEVSIEGISPMLINIFPKSVRDDVSIFGDDLISQMYYGSKKMKKEPNPDERFNYVKDRFVFPAGGLKQSLISAAGKIPAITKASVKTGLIIEPCFLPLNYSYVIFRQDTIEKPRSTRKLCWWEFWGWSIDFRLQYFHSMSDSKLESLLVTSGDDVGLGHKRPQKRGEYGRFKISEFKEI